MKRIFYWLYDLLLIIAFILFSPVILYKIISTPEYRQGLGERFGLLSAKVREKFSGEPTIWIHAASVGETGAAVPVVEELRSKFPDHKFLFSTMTATGQEMAKKTIEEADEFIYFPLDFPWVMKKVMKLINPELIVIMETELWPNFIKSAKETGSEVMIASGRISDGSLKHYKLLKSFTEDVLNKIDAFSMQSKEDRGRIISLGAPEDRVYNNGNTKFDQEYGVTDEETIQEIYREFKLDPDQPIIVAGSTHEGEEEKLVSVYQKLKEEFPELVLLLAPRYIDRTDEIEKLYQKAGIKVVRRSEIETRDPKEESVILVDTIGELAKLYGVADLVFIGGSLIERGGHNILEPAAQGKLVFFGPHMFNFRDSTELLLEGGAGLQAANVEELTTEMLYYLKHRDELKAKSKQALELIEKNKGAAKRNVKLAKELTDQKEILFIRLSAIGDVIHALPAAKALRKAYPDAKISWAVQEKAKDLVLDNPYLDQVIVVPKEEWSEGFSDDLWGTIKEIRSFFAGIRKENNFDLVLDVHGLFKSALTAYLSGGFKRVGPADGREGSTLFYTEKKALPDKELHQVDRNLYLAEAVGGDIEEVSFEIAVSKEEKERVTKLLSKAGLEKTEKLVVINPFTTWESKNWPLEKYARAADQLISSYNFEVVFTGGPTDREPVEELTEMMKENAFNLAGKTSLKELAELYSRAQLFIGGDTGPMHLAAAVEIPVLALMGPTNPATHGPYGKGHKVIQKDINCKGCWDRTCKKNNECMEEITAEEVVEEAVSLLEREKRCQ